MLTTRLIDCEIYVLDLDTTDVDVRAQMEAKRAEFEKSLWKQLWITCKSQKKTKLGGKIIWNIKIRLIVVARGNAERKKRWLSNMVLRKTTKQNWNE